jgi:hypothetical protein
LKKASLPAALGYPPVQLIKLIRQPPLLVPLGAALLIAMPGARAAAPATTAQAIPLECRLEEGPWQACRMEVKSIGSQWAMVVGGQRWEFRHDGHGNVTMQRPGGTWQPVSSHWDSDSLCWDGVCARGAIPLD